MIVKHSRRARLEKLERRLKPIEKVFILVGKNAPLPPKAIEAKARGEKVCLVMVNPFKAEPRSEEGGS